MDAKDGVARGVRRLRTDQILKGFRLQRLNDGAQAVGAFRMPGAHFVAETGRMRQEDGCHGRSKITCRSQNLWRLRNRLLPFIRMPGEQVRLW